MQRLILSGFALVTVLCLISCGVVTTTAGGTAGGTPTGSGTGTGQHLYEGDCDLLGTPFGGGTGTGSSPYLICTVDHLKSAAKTDYAAAHFLLVKDLDLADAGIMQISGFTGVFDGNGKILTNLSGAGLFASSSGTIRNVTLKAANVNGSFRAGVLVGWNQVGGQVINSHAEGSLVTSYHSGGLVGLNEGTITGSSANVSVSTNDTSGGFVGANKGTIDRCSATGKVVGARHNLGGFVGHHIQGVISNSFARGTVTGGKSTAGVSNIGGFVGLNEAAISNSYSTGIPSGTGTNVGGFGGSSSGTVASSYWDMDTSGTATSSGGTGKNTVDMLSESTYVGWDFVTLWRMAGSYPIFK